MVSGFQFLLHASLAAKPSNDDDLAMFGTLICEEDEWAFGPFSVRVFLRHITLNISFGTSSVRQDTVYASYDRPSAIEVSYEISDEAASSERSEQDAASAANAKTGIELGTVARLATEKSSGASRTAKYSELHPLVRYSRGENVLRWTFQPAPHEPYLYGIFLNEVQLCKFDKGDSPVHADIQIPKHGVFTSPSRFSNIREQRRLNIFALVVRRAIAGRHPTTVSYQ